MIEVYELSSITLCVKLLNLPGTTDRSLKPALPNHPGRALLCPARAAPGWGTA